MVINLNNIKSEQNKMKKKVEFKKLAKEWMAKSYYKDIHNTREMHFSTQMNLFLQLFYFIH